MTILQQFIQNADKSKKHVGIGLGDVAQSNQQIIQAAQRVAVKSSGKILIVGHHSVINDIKDILIGLPKNIDFIGVADPAMFLIDNIFNPKLISIENKDPLPKIDAVIRGGISSDSFLKKIRTNKDVPKGNATGPDSPIGQTYRLALLETANGHQFFYGPVGIDEANNFRDKQALIDHAIVLMNKMKIVPKIAILSGGRLGDVGRDPWVDQNIEEAENLTRKLQKDYPNLDIKHYQILVEKAIAEQCNLILAPEGIAGNLIYRTLIHLGAGKSYGALYLSQYNSLQKIIIDTSRAAPRNEYEGALFIALGLE